MLPPAPPPDEPASPERQRWRPDPAPTLPARQVDDILGDHADLVRRIRLCFGLDRAAWDAEVLPLIRRHAAHVHLLPATADNFFCQPGGLLQLSLETGFFSLQGTDAHIFSGRATISERRQLEPRWRLATFIGGLCSELHRTVNLVTVTSQAGHDSERATQAPSGSASSATSARQPWPALLQPLADWLQAGGVSGYRVHWHRDQAECRGLGLFVIPQVVPAATLQHLATGNQVVVTHLLACIGGVPLPREHNVLEALVRRSLALVIDRQLRGQADQTGRTFAGAHWARYLVQAMQRLVATSASWRPNGDKSRVCWGPDGLYLLWPQAATDIRALLESEQLAGLPDSADAMLDALAASGVLAAQAEGQWLWPICPGGTRGQLMAVRLTTPEVLLSGADRQAQPLTDRLTTVIPDRPAATPTEPPHAAETAEPSAPQYVPADAHALPDSHLRRTPPHPAQAELFGKPGEPAATASSAHASTDASAQPPPAAAPLRLQAPMRLNPSVRETLSAIVASLGTQGHQADAVLIREGAFIPVAALQAYGLQPSMAVRALADAGMLASAAQGTPPLQTRDIDGEPVQGLLIDGRWIDGLDTGAQVTRVIPSTPQP